jgi:alkylation response protein AidB-like acyl-CoA dehydrogenase
MTEKLERLIEPSFLCGIPTPYYTRSHIDFQKGLRQFLDREVLPYVDDWCERKAYPHHLHEELYRLGAQQAVFRFDPEFGGPPTGAYDSFHELIVWAELSRVSLNSVTFMMGIDSMAAPPIVKYGNDDLKRTILPAVVQGKMHVALAITEGTAGSDVANIRTSAAKSADGRFYIVNGQKKWISGGDVCSYFTCVVRTNDNAGGKGISVIVIPKNSAGLSVRPMKMQFDSVMRTCIVDFDNVQVPVENLIGKENDGLRIILSNFSHERFIIAVSAVACARRCFELALKHSMKRKTFNQRLIDHQMIRFKLAEMARTVEGMQTQIEQVAYVLDNQKTDENFSKALGELCALTKVNCTKGFEYCAREASQIFGGLSLVRDGIGKEVEAFYRTVRAHAIPGGSEEILLDLAIKSATNYKASRI